MVFARPDEQETCQYHCSLHLLDLGTDFLVGNKMRVKTNMMVVTIISTRSLHFYHGGKLMFISAIWLVQLSEHEGYYN